MNETCATCFFSRQDWLLDWTNDKGNIQYQLVLDFYCDICDIFKKPEGFCDMWESK